MSLSKSTRAIRQANASIRAKTLNAKDHTSPYRLCIYWLLYPFRCDKSSNNHTLLSFLFAIVIACFAVGSSLVIDSPSLDCFIGLQCLNAIVGSITLFDANQYVASWQIRKLALYATLPWSNHRLRIDYLRGVIKRGLVFFLTSIFMSIGYCIYNPEMQTLDKWAPCILATVATIVFMLTISCLLTSISNPTTRDRVWRCLAWLRCAALAIAMVTFSVKFLPMFYVRGWPEFLSWFRFLPTGWPFALLQSLLETGANYRVGLLSVAWMGTAVLLGQTAWRRLQGRMRVVEFFGNDNRNHFGILPCSSTSEESYIRQMDDVESSVLKSPHIGFAPELNRDIGQASDSVERHSHGVFSLNCYRDRFWEAHGRLRPCFERLLTEEERTVVAIVYSHMALPKLREIVGSLTFISLACLILIIASETYLTWLPVSKYSGILGYVCVMPIVMFAARFVSGVNLYVYRFMPFSASALVVAIWKFTIAYWLIGVGAICPFFVLYFQYFGWPLHYVLEVIAIAFVVVPCVAMITQLASLFVGTKQRIKPLDILSCIVLAMFFLALAIAIVALMIHVDDSFGRIASSLLYWPWTYALYRWAIYRFNHQTLDLGAPWKD
jgi:hypothetical protein